MTEHSIQHQHQTPSQQLDAIESSLSSHSLSRLYQILQKHELRFIALPSASTAPEALPPPGVLQLDPYFHKNRTAIDHEEMLGRHSRSIATLSNVPNKEVWSRVETCAARIKAEMQFFLNWKSKMWKRQLLMASEVLTVDPGIYMDSPFKSLPSTVALTHLTVVSTHYLSGLSYKDSDYLLSALTLQSQISSPKRPPPIPVSARTIIEQLNLSPKTAVFACCPHCFFLYEMDKPYPQLCTNRAAPDQPVCGAEVYADDRARPHREYVMQDFHDWLARFYARPDIENYLDRNVLSCAPDVMHDVWDGKAFREFRGHDGKLFLECPESESRLLFSINMDGFNPLSNKQGGKQISCSAIYMVCLNLPPHLRYRPENVFLVGVIPGPHEPSVTQINYILRPLVDVLGKLWDVGLFLKRTHRYPFGRRSRVGVVPLVADLPACRKAAGFGSATCKHFCSCCNITLEDKDNVDIHQFSPRDFSSHFDFAQQWRDAQTLKEQEIIFDQSGVRWSELLRLPYWDPTSYATIDSMHCFYLGILHHHVLKVWGMQEKAADGPGVTYNAVVNKPSNVELDRGRHHLQLEEWKPLVALPKATLVYLCFEKGLRFAGRSKNILVGRLREWRAQKKGTTSIDADPVPHLPSITSSIFDSTPYLLKSPQSSANLISHRTMEQIVSTQQQTLTHGLRESGSAYRTAPLPVNASPPLANVSEPSSIPPQPNWSTRPEQALSITTVGTAKASISKKSKGDSLTPEEIQDYWISAFKSTLLRLSKVHLYQILSTKSPNTSIKSENLKADILNEIQRLRKAEQVIDTNDKPVQHAARSTAPASASRRYSTRLSTGSASITRGGANTNNSISMGPNFHEDFSFDEEFETFGGMDLDNELSDWPKAGPRKDTVKSDRSPAKPQKETCVLGKEKIADIKLDMARTIVPSWVPRGPKNPGSTKQGKLHADQWRSFCTINLVITLVRLWGSEPKDSRERLMLTNFLHLVSAVKYASLRVVTEESIIAYEFNIRAYLRTLLELYPGTELVPNQHMALHFGDQLRRFGPTHGWRCFAFERFNYLLQQVQTNTIENQMEKTMFNSFCIMQRLRPLFDPSQLPNDLHPIAVSFHKTYDRDTRGTFMSEDFGQDIKDSNPADGKLQQLPTDTFALLRDWYEWNNQASKEISRHVYFCNTTSSHVIYKTAKQSESDSHVMFRKSQETAWHAGSIASIFQHQLNGVETTFFVVHPYIPAKLETIHPDVFQPAHEFSFVAGQLFKVEGHLQSTLVSVAQVIGHFAYAKTDYCDATGSTLFQALPLEKQ
ncbi:hypothetical protein Agabi119p4_6152 [Agaricus bisporus var. burnettii]|uniref:DUF4218 domain-containing protein n=1 Tax=Agaricus bisporus var. burnettii TaxID=192524 RepID=A0A8H7KGB9_AGABI|nr:hypothetical protein Agabi119p4_6152 [Agaricus bisporus var. burnettii]